MSRFPRLPGYGPGKRPVIPALSPQFALGRKVPLGDALIVAAHKRRGSDPGQGKKFLRRIQLATVSAVRINHDSAPLADISTAPVARKGAVCEEANYPSYCAPQATLQRHRPTGRPAAAKMVWSPVRVSHGPKRGSICRRAANNSPSIISRFAISMLIIPIARTCSGCCGGKLG
jgi:hypothetical protein